MTTSTGPGTAVNADITGVEGFDHGFTSRFNAWFFTVFDRLINDMAAVHKDAAFGGIDAPVVVELGAGTGANFDRLPVGARLHAIEPSRRMHRMLHHRAAAAGVDLHVQPSGAERIDLPDASVDEVICSLVLCTVRDPDAVIGEVRRVLRSGGRFRFVEHVAATGVRGAVQRALRRPWGWLFEGCDPHRDSASAIRAAGFAEVTIEDRKFRRSPFWPVNTAVWGIATR
jgi:SAM-dependent methyltransferase